MAVKHVTSSLKKRTPVTLTLTDRERALLRLLCRDFNELEIVNEMKLPVTHVRKHMGKLLEKTGTKTSHGLVVYALRHRLIGWS